MKRKKEENRFLFACLLKYYEINNIFPDELTHLPKKLQKTIAKQLNLPKSINSTNERTIRHYKKQIQDLIRVQPNFNEREQALKDWFISRILPDKIYTEEQIIEVSQIFFKETKLKRISVSRIKRVYKSSFVEYENNLITNITSKLLNKDVALLNGLLLIPDESKNNQNYLYGFKRDIKGVSLNAILEESARLKYLNEIKIPASIESIPLKQLKCYYKFLTIQKPARIKLFSDNKRHFLLCIFVYLRRLEISDNMIDLFSRLLQRSSKNSRSFIKKQFSNISEIKKVYCKDKLLFMLAQACMKNPSGIIKTNIFSAVPEATLQAIIEEYLNKKNAKSFKEVLHRREALLNNYFWSSVNDNIMPVSLYMHPAYLWSSFCLGVKF